MSRRTAIVCFYEAYPPVSGAAAVSFNLAKFLPGETILIQSGSRAGSADIEGVRVVTVPLSSERKTAKITSLAGRIRRILNELRNCRAQLVVLEGASWAVYHWMLLRTIRRALPGVRIVYHAHNVEFALRRERSGRAIAAITRFAEARLLAECDLVTAVSEVDRTLFRELYQVDTALLPNGVDAARFASVSPAEAALVRARYGIGRSAIVFSGLYAYPPNRVAIDFLLKEVMPPLLAHVPDAELVITGGDMPGGARWLITPGVVPYEELPALLASCRVAAAPIFSGSGTRLKILEAMAAGVPVVSTAKGAEGLPFRHGEHLLIANDASAFVERLRLVLTESRLRDRLTARAKKTVQQRFDWPAIVQVIDHQMNLTRFIAAGAANHVKAEIHCK